MCNVPCFLCGDYDECQIIHKDKIKANKLNKEFVMEKCKKYFEHKYRVFEHYFGKFDNVQAICDCPDKETAKRIINVFNSYYEKRPFEFFLKEIE